MAAPEPKPPYATGYPAPSTSTPYPAYPYPPPPYYCAAPPPQQPYYYNNSSGDNDDNPSSASTSLFCRFFLGVIIVFVLIGVINAVVWLILRQQLPSFSVSSASISSFNLSSSSSLLSSNFDLTLWVNNTNKKMTVYYDSIDAAIFLGSSLASENSLTPFSQDKDNSTEIVAKLSALERYLDAGTVDAVLGTRRSEGAVHLNFRVLSRVRFKVGPLIRTRRRSLRVYCDDLKISFANGTSTSGTMVGSPKDCTVK